MFKFEILEIWKKSINLFINISELLKTFPNNERHALSDQLRRSALSIPTNIAEGCGAESDKEFNRFLTYSIRSTYETMSLIIAAKRLNYITKHKFDELYQGINYLIRQIQSFKKCKKVK